jgi:hypothetical protein
VGPRNHRHLPKARTPGADFGICAHPPVAQRQYGSEFPEKLDRMRLQCLRVRMQDYLSTRYDRSPKVYLSAVALAATVMFWL